MVTSLISALTRKSLAYAQPVAQAYAEGAMNSLIVITRKGGFDPATGEYKDPSADPQVIYDDPDFPGVGAPAGVTSTTGPTTMEFGDEPEYYDSVQVFIPRNGPNVMIDDVVHVTAGPDSDIIGRYYRVISNPSGGRLIPSSNLLCLGIAPSKQWKYT